MGFAPGRERRTVQALPLLEHGVRNLPERRQLGEVALAALLCMNKSNCVDKVGNERLNQRASCKQHYGRTQRHICHYALPSRKEYHNFVGFTTRCYI